MYLKHLHKFTDNEAGQVVFFRDSCVGVDVFCLFQFALLNVLYTRE